MKWNQLIDQTIQIKYNNSNKKQAFQTKYELQDAIKLYGQCKGRWYTNVPAINNRLLSCSITEHRQNTQTQLKETDSSYSDYRLLFMLPSAFV